MSEPTFLATLKSWEPCLDGYQWALDNKFESLDALWSKCHRADWMLWVVEKSGIKLDESKLRLFTCDCAEQALPAFESVYPNDTRPRETIAVMRRYAVGEATEEERDAAARAALSARSAALSAAAWAALSALSALSVESALSAESVESALSALSAESAESAAAWAEAGQYQADRLRIYFPSIEVSK